ncbi:synaptobrevin family protein, putative [Ichthyophthirius multifiliis]|uniref:Synaptobrevin family protein, putative n=1 Tax=Ichthyophthirius multifiliis TaxID=5932 RepID=G0R1E5_ICHMU|nr:synaptobrevin family protein, putative [Ichthyophthirius multifiliis]EGR28702.1 synaptobrevin family protein, putative [Ichthyophthirius multifiliis]|eukprot:XP_004029938.1 synaptobrevin family protein, putative [Ichthyophthirius multifiliis]
MNMQTKFALKIKSSNQSTNGWIALGVALQKKNFGFGLNVGHGAYLISSNKGSWSHSDANNNNIVKSFDFSDGNIVELLFDPIDGNQMSIIYVVVSRQDVFLADYTTSQGNFQNVMKQVVQNDIKKKFEYYNSSECDTITKIKQNINETKDVLIVNMDKIMDRGEKLDIICKKSEDMQKISHTMKRQAGKVHSAMKWRNYRMYIAIAIIVLSLIGIIVLICTV